MKTATIKGFIYKSSGSDTFLFSGGDMTQYGFLLVGPYEFEYELPNSFNPIAAEVAGLEKQLEKATKEHAQTVRRIKSRIQELLCIENSPSAA